MTEYDQIVREEKSLAYARGRAAVVDGRCSESEFWDWWRKRPSDEVFYLMWRARGALATLSADVGA